MLLTTENIILIGALLLLVSVFAGKVAYRFGAPALLLFLGVGMLFGLRLISFNSAPVAQFVGMVALCIILFSGGMDTRYRAIRPVIGPGVVLATVGVALTALIVAGFVYVVAPWCNAEMSFLLALLFAATMSSTDSASVFSILRSRRQGLSENLKPLLELESGSNDPMAYILTILLVGLLTPGESMGFGTSLLLFVVGMTLGVVAGYAFGRLAVWTINRINIENQSLYAVLLLAFVFLTFSVTDLIRGNGYLAVYVAGLVVGNYPIVHKKTLGTFFDGFTWLFQVILFVTLGLLVNIDELLQPEVLLLGGLTGLFMILVARPAAVFLSLLPFRKFTTRARLYVSWVGLRGRADHFRHLSRRGRRGGFEPAVQYRLFRDAVVAGRAGYDGQSDGRMAGVGLSRTGTHFQRRSDEPHARRCDDRADRHRSDVGAGTPLARHRAACGDAGGDGGARRDVFRPQGQFGAPRGRQAAGGDREQVGGEVGRPAAGVKRRATGRRTENPPLPHFCGRGGFPYGLVRLFGGGRSGTGLGGLQAAARGGGLPAGRRDACSREGRGGGLSADDYAWRADSSRSRSAIEHPVASSRTSRW